MTAAQQKSKKAISLVILCSFLAAGFTLPGCPDQKAIDERLDAANTKNIELTRKLNTFDVKLKETGTELGQLKTSIDLLQKMIDTQKQQIEQLDASLKALTLKPAAKTKPLRRR